MMGGAALGACIARAHARSDLVPRLSRARARPRVREGLGN